MKQISVPELEKLVKEGFDGTINMISELTVYIYRYKDRLQNEEFAVINIKNGGIYMTSDSIHSPTIEIETYPQKIRSIYNSRILIKKEDIIFSKIYDDYDYKYHHTVEFILSSERKSFIIPTSLEKILY